MAKVNVVIVDATGNKEQKVGLPDDIKCGIIMVKLVEKIKLPSVGPDGNPISYKFIHKVTGRQLLESQTLAEAGIKDGDVLRLQPEITAGACNLKRLFLCGILGCLLAVLILSLSGCKNSDYKEAMAAYEAGQWDAAKSSFQALGDYKGSAEMVQRCDYRKATELFGRCEYEDAQVLFAELGEYKDSTEMSLECQYQTALQLYNNDKYAEAVADFADIIEYDKAKAAVHKILFDLVTDDFLPILTDAATDFSSYISEQSDAMLAWGMDGCNGTFKIDYSFDQKFDKLVSARTAISGAKKDIHAIFTRDVLDKCDSEMKDACKKMDEAAEYACAFFTTQNAVNTFVSMISPSESPAYTIEGMTAILKELENAINSLK